VAADQELPELELEPEAEPRGRVAELLELQRMESALIRAELEDPNLVAPDVLRRVRYILRFAHLTEIGGSDGEGDAVQLAEGLDGFRAEVIEHLRPGLRDERNTRARLLRAHAALGQLADKLEESRTSLLERHAHELTSAQLDAELATKTLVNVAGGGGGAGYVYIGAYMRLHEAGFMPSYVVGTSIGAVIGLFAARSAEPSWDDYLTLARTLSARELFSPPTVVRRYGLPGIVRLRLKSTFGQLFSHDDGELTEISELEVRFEAVVAGVRRRSFDRLPARFRQPTGARVRGQGVLSRARLGAATASRMWQVAAFFDPRVVKPIVLGGDPLTRQLKAIDAAGFSASIPGVLHYDRLSPDPVTERTLEALFEREEVGALVDGGVTANVPAAIAWERVQAGAIGTRNAFLLAFDCFHPQWDPKHLWLQPITQAVALQRTRDVRYADWVLRFGPTLSPVTLVPAPETVDQAIRWGRDAVEPLIPMLERSLEPVWWEVPPPRESDRWKFWRRRSATRG
jgi:predicted acylesterase/phospholipase RssA